MKHISIILILVFVLSGCGKEKHYGRNCNEIRNSMIANDVDRMKLVMQELFLSLPSTDYNKVNIDLLIEKIKGCDIETGFYCFDCIDTYPSQTEIQLIIEHDGGTLKKTLDISYHHADNTLRFVNMHD